MRTGKIITQIEGMEAAILLAHTLLERDKVDAAKAVLSVSLARLQEAEVPKDALQLATEEAAVLAKEVVRQVREQVRTVTESLAQAEWEDQHGRKPS